MYRTRNSSKAFTLVEMLVSIAILALIVVMVGRLFSSAITLTSRSNKRFDADSQATVLLDRIQADFAQMLKRPDLDYYVKSAVQQQTGNDQIAFYTDVPGYYPSGAPSSASLVAYRVNSSSNSANYNRMERLAKGLIWSGSATSPSPLVFYPLTISNTWPSATNNTDNTDYELIAPGVFRFEYFYLRQDGSVSMDPSISRTAVSGMQDVSAISVCIAVIDSKSRVLASDAQLNAVASHLIDFSDSMLAGDLIRRWQDALNTSTDIPRETASAIRLYERYFPLSPKR